MDAALQEALADDRSPVMRIVRARIEEELTEHKLTMVAKRHLERVFGPDSVAYQVAAARKEAIGFSLQIKAITAAHVETVVGRLIAANVNAVATPLVTAMVDQRMNTWQPDEGKVDSAVWQVATASAKETVGCAIELSLCDARNVSSPLRHTMSSLVRHNIMHLCPQSEVERMIGEQFARLNHFQAWSQRMETRSNELATRLEQEAKRQQENIKIYVEPLMQELTSHKTDLLQELTRQAKDVGGHGTGIAGEDAVDAVVCVGEIISNQLNALANELLAELEEKRDEQRTNPPDVAPPTAEEVAQALYKTFPSKRVLDIIKAEYQDVRNASVMGWVASDVAEQLQQDELESVMMRNMNARTRAYLDDSEAHQFMTRHELKEGLKKRTPQHDEIADALDAELVQLAVFLHLLLPAQATADDAGACETVRTAHPCTFCKHRVC